MYAKFKIYHINSTPNKDSFLSNGGTIEKLINAAICFFCCFYAISKNRQLKHAETMKARGEVTFQL